MNGVKHNAQLFLTACFTSVFSGASDFLHVAWARRLCVAWSISLSKHMEMTSTCSTRVFLGDNISKCVFGGPGGCILRALHSRVPPEAPTPRIQRTPELFAQRGGQDICLDHWGGG